MPSRKVMTYGVKRFASLEPLFAEMLAVENSMECEAGKDVDTREIWKKRDGSQKTSRSESPAAEERAVKQCAPKPLPVRPEPRPLDSPQLSSQQTPQPTQPSKPRRPPQPPQSSQPLQPPQPSHPSWARATVATTAVFATIAAFATVATTAALTTTAALATVATTAALTTPAALATVTTTAAFTTVATTTALATSAIAATTTRTTMWHRIGGVAEPTGGCCTDDVQGRQQNYHSGRKALTASEPGALFRPSALGARQRGRWMRHRLREPGLSTCRDASAGTWCGTRLGRTDAAD